MRSWRLTLAIWLMRREGVKRYGRNKSFEITLRASTDATVAFAESEVPHE